VTRTSNRSSGVWVDLRFVDVDFDRRTDVVAIDETPTSDPRAGERDDGTNRLRT